MTLERLFPGEDYRFFLRFERVPPQDFFRPTAANQMLLGQRRHWLEREPERYSALLPEGLTLLERNKFSWPRMEFGIRTQAEEAWVAGAG